MHTQGETQIADPRGEFEPYRQRGAKKSRVRVWTSKWVVLGETLNGLWYFILPRRLGTRYQDLMTYKAAMCWKQDWDNDQMERVVIFKPLPDTLIVTCIDGSVKTVSSFSTMTTLKTETAQSV